MLSIRVVEWHLLIPRASELGLWFVAAVCELSDHIRSKKLRESSANHGERSCALLNQISNQLASMRLYVVLLRQQLQRQSAKQNYILSIEQGLNSCNRIVSQLNSRFHLAPAERILASTSDQNPTKTGHDPRHTAQSEHACAVRACPPNAPDNSLPSSR